MTSLDDVFRVLADPIRRASVSELREGEGDVIELDDLAERLAVDRTEHTVETLERDLHHVHLPKLQSVGVLEYDGRSKIVRYHETPAIFEVIASETALEEDRDERERS